MITKDNIEFEYLPGDEYSPPSVAICMAKVKLDVSISFDAHVLQSHPELRDQMEQNLRRQLMDEIYSNIITADLNWMR